MFHHLSYWCLRAYITLQVRFVYEAIYSIRHLFHAFPYRTVHKNFFAFFAMFELWYYPRDPQTDLTEWSKNNIILHNVFSMKYNKSNISLFTIHYNFFPSQEFQWILSFVCKLHWKTSISRDVISIAGYNYFYLALPKCVITYNIFHSSFLPNYLYNRSHVSITNKRTIINYLTRRSFHRIPLKQAMAENE